MLFQRDLIKINRFDHVLPLKIFI